MVANPARGPLNRENDYFPIPVRAWEFGLARRARPSRPASARSFSTLRLKMVVVVNETARSRYRVQTRTSCSRTSCSTSSKNVIQFKYHTWYYFSNGPLIYYKKPKSVLTFSFLFCFREKVENFFAILIQIHQIRGTRLGSLTKKNISLIFSYNRVSEE